MSSEDAFAMMAGRLLGIILIVIGPVLIGYVVARKLNKNREHSDSVRWPVIVGSLVSALFLLGQCSAKNQNKAAGINENAVEVIDGIAQEPFPDEVDPQSLEANRVAITETIQREYRNVLGEVDSRMITERFGGKTIMIFDAKGSLGPSITQYVGVIDGKRKDVICTFKSAERVPACKSKVIEIFGQPTALSKQAN